MKSKVDACRESCSGKLKAAHIGGCIAAIVVTVVLVVAKLGSYLPASMTSLRITLVSLLAYGLVSAAMCWKLGRAIKRAKAEDDSAAAGVVIPQLT